MRRREFIAMLGGAAAGWPLGARAQQSNRLRLVGVLFAMAPSDPEAEMRVKAFETGLRELGWVEGRNMRLEYRWAPRDPGLLLSQASELVGLGPDVILATSTPVAAALRQGNPPPVVFVQVIDPIGNGFVQNLARPGGNLTGFTNFEYLGKASSRFLAGGGDDVVVTTSAGLSDFVSLGGGSDTATVSTE